MSISIHDYVSGLIGEKLGGDAGRFDELWLLVPDLAETLRRFDADSGWLHWRPKTFDGWYCVAQPGAGFEVYYQERGIRDAGVMFSDQRAAIRCALEAGVIDLPPPPGA